MATVKKKHATTVHRTTRFPSEVVDYVRRMADEDADVVAHFLRTLAEHASDAWPRPTHLPAAFLLGLGAALRVAAWEVLGFDAHRRAGLPSPGRIFASLLDHCLNRTPAERDAFVVRLAVTVHRVAVDGFAWQAAQQLGAEVMLLGAVEEEDLVEALAQFAWRARHRVEQ
jgi:hypothetical protein